MRIVAVSLFAALWRSLINSPIALAAGESSDVYVEPGEAIWLGDYGSGDGTPPIEDHLPVSYVVFGHRGVAIPRVLVRPNESCPPLVAEDDSGLYDDTGSATRTIPKVTVRTVGNSILPEAFPIKVCEVQLSDTHHKRAWTEGKLHFDGIPETTPIPTDPKRYVLIGDTGLRVKPTDVGLGECKANYTMYDIPQCPVNFTENDLQFPGTGDFQSLSDWPLKTLQSLAAAELEELRPDAIVYVGDYLYRQGPCPANNTQGEDCVAINAPAGHFNASEDLVNDTVANFIPGNWGDNLYGWWADFFYPSLDMLKVAPLIAIRGNHENCVRAGPGYFVFLAVDPYPEGAVAGSHCKKYHEPFAVSFDNEQFLVVDDSEISPKDEGIDHFQFINGSCPGVPADGEPPIVPIPQNRFEDTNQKNASILEQLAWYTQVMEFLYNESLSYETNFYASHRPIFAIACNDSDIVTLDWTIQQSLAKNTLDRVSAAIGGHMHWMEALTFRKASLPSQIVVGNGGTKMIPNYINQDAIPGIVLEVGREKSYKGVVETGITSSAMFGFGVMERNDETGNYDVKFLGLDPDSQELVEVDYGMTIRKGPRVQSAAAPDDGDASGASILRSFLPTMVTCGVFAFSFLVYCS